MHAPSTVLRAARSVRAPTASAGRRWASTISVTSHSTSESALPLSNVEAQWAKLAKDEQVEIYRQLEGLQKKDWKALTLDEKKAGAFLKF